MEGGVWEMGKEKQHPTGLRVVWLSIKLAMIFSLTSSSHVLHGILQPKENCFPRSKTHSWNLYDHDRVTVGRAPTMCWAPSQANCAHYRESWRQPCKAGSSVSTSLEEGGGSQRGPGASRGPRTREGAAQTWPQERRLQRPGVYRRPERRRLVFNRRLYSIKERIQKCIVFPAQKLKRPS